MLWVFLFELFTYLIRILNTILAKYEFDKFIQNIPFMLLNDLN